MKALLILVIIAVLATLSAADGTDPEDLGVLSRKRPIHFPQPTNAAPSDSLALRLFPLANQTNILSITTTNWLLTVHDLAGFPDGLAIIEAKVVAADGDLGYMRFYRVQVRRRPPAAPTAVPVLLRDEEETTAQSVPALTFIRQRALAREPAPAPPGAIRIVPTLRTNALMGPLPGGSNVVYRPEKRRSE